jgi:RimJ/RimL family protein N-acetyltransferase
MILSWNERSRRFAERLGFAQDGDIGKSEGRFLIMRKAAGSPRPRNAGPWGVSGGTKSG